MNYQPYAETALEKLKEYGSPITIKHSGKREYNPATNTYTDGGTEITGFAILRNYNQHNIDGTNIRIGDVQFMASLHGKPFVNDEIIFESKKYTVVNVTALAPDGKTDIFYTIQAR